MKNLLILLAIPLFFISCVRDNDDSEQNNLVSFDVSMSIPSVSVSLAIDSSDNLYIGERDNSRIRKISL